MKYVGSKDRLSKDLKPIIESFITPETKGYLEPFVGGANMIDKIECENKIGNDIHPYLVALLNELSKGWIPPKDLDEDTYKDIQVNHNKYPNYLVGYAGFQLSYGGKWFGGYRRDKTGKRNYALEAYTNTTKQAPKLQDIKFTCQDFRELPLDAIKDYVVYCDIPYKGTTKYQTNAFPYEEFYEWAKTASISNKILISEYDMPEDFSCIWQKEVKTLLDSNKDSGDDANIRVEKLYTYESRLN